MKIADDTPITQADIDGGRLLLRKRGATGIEVLWSDEDEGYIATFADLPGCSACFRALGRADLLPRTFPRRVKNY